MTIDFTNIKEIEIPEGNAIELSIDGQVVWVKSQSLNGSITFNVADSIDVILIGTTEVGSISSGKKSTYARRTTSEYRTSSLKDSSNNIEIIGNKEFIAYTGDPYVSSKTCYSRWLNTYDINIDSAITYNLNGSGIIRLSGVIAILESRDAISVKSTTLTTEEAHIDFAINNGQITDISLPVERFYSEASSGTTRYLIIVPKSVEVVE